MEKSLLFFSTFDGLKELKKKILQRSEEAKIYFLKHLVCKGKMEIVKEYQMSDGFKFILQKNDCATFVSIEISLMEHGGIIMAGFKTQKLSKDKEKEKICRFWANDHKSLEKQLSLLNALLRKI